MGSLQAATLPGAGWGDQMRLGGAGLLRAIAQRMLADHDMAYGQGSPTRCIAFNPPVKPRQRIIGAS